MAITCRDIITAALKMARVYSPGEDPSDEDMTDGMFALQGMFDAWVAQGMFGRLTDVYEDEAYEAQEGERVTSTSTVTTPTTIEDGGTRAPYDLSLIEAIESGVRTVYLYDRTGWVEIQDLSLGDTCPLATRGRVGLAACLAVEYVGQFGGEAITPAIVRSASQFKAGLSLKLGSTSKSSESVYF